MLISTHDLADYSQVLCGILALVGLAKSAWGWWRNKWEGPMQLRYPALLALFFVVCVASGIYDLWDRFHQPPVSAANESSHADACIAAPGRDEPGWDVQKEATRLAAKYVAEHLGAVDKAAEIQWVNHQLISECLPYVVTTVATLPHNSVHPPRRNPTPHTGEGTGIVGAKENDFDDVHVDGFTNGMDFSHSEKAVVKHSTATAPKGKQ